MKRATLIFLSVLLPLALLAPAANGATQLRRVQVEVTQAGFTPPPVPGKLTLDFTFKNKRGSKKKFTPRQLTRVDFANVPLTCANGHTSSPGTTQLIYNATFAPGAKFKKVPPPKHPKPGRYSFRFSYAFPGLLGTIGGTIDKPNQPGKRPLRAHISLDIEDLDVDPGHSDCSTNGTATWGGVPVPLA